MKRTNFMSTIWHFAFGTQHFSNWKLHVNLKFKINFRNGFLENCTKTNPTTQWNAIGALASDVIFPHRVKRLVGNFSHSTSEVSVQCFCIFDITSQRFCYVNNNKMNEIADRYNSSIEVTFQWAHTLCNNSFMQPIRNCRQSQPIIQHRDVFSILS